MGGSPLMRQKSGIYTFVVRVERCNPQGMMMVGVCSAPIKTEKERRERHGERGGAGQGRDETNTPFPCMSSFGSSGAVLNGFVGQSLPPNRPMKGKSDNEEEKERKGARKIG